MIGENEAGQRVDRFLRKYLGGAPLSAIYRIIRKDLKVNGRRVREDTQLEEGDELTLYMTQEQLEASRRPSRPKSSSRRQFQTVYEDDQVLIVSKPKGLLTHGDAHEKSNTLMNQVCGYLQDKGEYDPAAEKTFTPSPVNRLDRNTTGLVIFGKTGPALRALSQVIRERDQVRKLYLAIVAGSFSGEMNLQDQLQKDSARNFVSRTASGDSQMARTIVREKASGRNFSLVEAELVTGRTHQIRVHLAGAGYPLAGDAKYGDPKVNAIVKKHHITTQLLHAYKLEFGEMPQIIGGLSGRTVSSRPPREFQRAGKDLIDVGISFT